MTVLHILIKGYELDLAGINFEKYNPAYCFAAIKGRTFIWKS